MNTLKNVFKYASRFEALANGNDIVSIYVITTEARVHCFCRGRFSGLQRRVANNELWR
jgi:hypothetical protein